MWIEKSSWWWSGFDICENIEFEQRENIFFFNYSVPKLVTTLNFNLLERLLGFVFVPVSTDRKNEATKEKESKQKKR